MVTEKDYKELKNRVCFAMRKYGGDEQDFEDAANHIVINWIKKGKTGQTIDQATIDYLRSQHGDKRSVSGNLKQSERRRSFEYDVSRDKRCYISNGQGVGEYTVGFEPIDRAMVILKYEWGLNEKEIAYCFGYYPKRVHLWVKRIQKRISERIKKEESGISGEREVEMEKVLRKKETKRSLLEYGETKAMEGIESW